MSTELQGTQMQLPIDMVKKLETLRNNLNLDRGVIVQALMETCFDTVLSEKGKRILEIQNERSLAKLSNMLPDETTKKPVTPVKVDNSTSQQPPKSNDTTKVSK